MISRIFVIILLLCAGVPPLAEAAHLTFGAAPGATRTLNSEAQARRLAASLAAALEDEVSVRLFDDQLQLGQWLNQFAMIDLAVMDKVFLEEHAGEFLVLGPVDQEAQLLVVARQGAAGDLPQRLIGILRRDGGMAPAPDKAAMAAVAPPAGVEPPPQRPPVVSAEPLVLGLIAGREGVFGSPAEAERFAADLGERLGTAIRVRQFDNERTLADWFSRFRMIDLAVIGEPDRRDPLVGDYRQLQSFEAGKGRKGLLVARRDLPETRLPALTAFDRPAEVDEQAVSPPVAAPVASVTPAPAAPVPPEPPVWPAVPSLPPAPAPPETALPAPVVPPLPELPVMLPAEAEPQVLPEAAPDSVEAASVAEAAPPSPVAPPSEVLAPPTAVVPPPALPGEPVPTAPEPAGAVMPAEISPPAELAPVPEASPLPFAPVDGFRMPASIGPIAEGGEPQARPLAEPAGSPPSVLPEVAAPVEPLSAPAVATEPPPMAVAEPPVAEAPPAPAPAPPEPAVAEAVPPTAAEPPITPVPPAAIAEEAAPTTGQEQTEETAVAVPVPEEAVPVVTMPPATATPQAVPEAIPELPFVPVPPRVIEEGAPAVAGQQVAVVASEVATPAPVAEDSPLVLEGADKVPEVIAQPDLPQELRPPGVPLPRPGRLPQAPPPADEPPLLAKLQEPLGRTPKPPPLLPQPDAEPGVVYVAPFITLMVPAEVRERIFDQFIDTLNRRGAEQKLKFVILKQGINKIDRTWLNARKYALGEIYGYVEDSGCCSTDLRTRVRLTFYRAHQTEPALKFEYPIRTFFDHERSTLTVERQKLADRIAAALADELFKALTP